MLLLEGASLEPGSAFLGVERSFRERRWVAGLSAEAERIASAIANRCGVPEVVARVLSSRGITVESADAFLAPSLKAQLPDPSSLTDLDAAAERIADAVLRRESVAIFGDYDVDGATASALLHDLLSGLGLKPRIFIPDRIADGYGLNSRTLDALIDAGATLVIAVDCGTTAPGPVAHAQARGVDVVIVDHHRPAADLPPARALVNPNRPDDLSGLGHLAAVGVAFMLAVGLVRTLRARNAFASGREPDLLALLDLVALGTVCDVVPLIGLNRAFVTRGLAVLGRRARPGLAALAAASRLNGPVTARHLGFMLGPRINAGGRIGDSSLGARLLTCLSADEADRIAATLDRLNGERQAIETAALDEALARFQEDEARQAPVLTAVGETWHPGVVGLVASRLAERFGRPAFAVTFAIDADAGTGSARSVPGVDLGELIAGGLREGLLAKGGGHAMAAGFTIARNRLDAFRDYLRERVAALMPDGMKRAEVRIAGVLTAEAVNGDLAEALERTGPFGPGAPEPIFVMPGHAVASLAPVGTDHLRVRLRSATGVSMTAMAYRAQATPLGDALKRAMGERIHVAGSVSLDRWRGTVSPQFRIIDAAPRGGLVASGPP